MSEQESTFIPEEEKKLKEEPLGPTAKELAEACKEILTEEDCEDLAAMPIDEAMGYAFTLLIEQGIEDPEQFLRERKILE